MKNVLLLSVLLSMIFCFQEARSQGVTVKGKVIDENAASLPGALVRLVDRSDSSRFFIAITDLEGNFALLHIPPHTYRLDASAVGRRTTSVPVTVENRNLDVGRISMGEAVIPMRGVTVEGRVPPAVQNGDTTEYVAAGVKINRDATAEDLLSKLPGVIVSNGTITAGGETVQRVLVDGRPFFGDDPTVAVRTLPAEVIDRIQVFDQMSDQAQFTGFDDGQSVKAINIITRRNRQGMNFGKLTAGYGDNQRYDAAGNVNFFDGNSRLSFLGSSNNVNQQDFSTQDILGVISNRSVAFTPGSGGFRGGGQRRANPFGRSGAISSNNQFVGQQQGINNTSMAGTNASDSLSDNLFAQGSYFFNRVGNQNNQLDHRQYLLGGDSTSLYDQNSNAASTNYNNRLSGRIDYAADESNKLTVLPVIYFQSNRADNLLNAVTTQNASGSQSLTNSGGLNDGYNITGHVVYRHAFDLPGRTLSINVGGGANKKMTNGNLSAANDYSGTNSPPDDSLNQVSNYNSDVKTVSANLIYTQATDVNAMFELIYNPSFTRNSADKSTYDFNPGTDSYSSFDAPLSNSYYDDYMTQRVGIGYRWRGTGTNFMGNLSYQYADLTGDGSAFTNSRITRSFGDFLPSALFMYTTPEHRTLRIFYRTYTVAPAVTQLQQVVDNSNPLLLSTGNPNLVQSYTHSLLARYAITTPGRASSMFLFLIANYTNAYVADATVIPSRDTVLSNGTSLTPGTQLTYPVNLDGYWNVRSFFTYGLPFDLISSALNLNAGLTFTRTPGQLNDVVSKTNSIGPTAGFVIGSNISQNFDFTISYMGSYNFARNSIQPISNSNYYSHTASVKWVWEFWSGIVLDNQLSNALTNGLSAGYDQNIILWNLGVAKKFFANESGELRIAVNDLLGENKSVNRSITDTYIDDTRNEVLTRYVLVSFSYTLR